MELVELLVALEAKLVLGLFVDDIAVLLQLVMADAQLPVAYQAVVELLEGLDAKDLEKYGDVVLMTPLDKERFVKFFTDAKLATDLVDDKSGKDDATTGIGP